MSNEFSPYSGTLDHILNPAQEKTSSDSVATTPQSEGGDIVLPVILETEALDHAESSETSLSSSSSPPISLVATIGIANTFAVMTEYCLQTVTTVSEFDQLYSVTIDLDAVISGGSAAFVLAILIFAPNEEVVQIGGYQTYYTADRLWNRMWPTQWASAKAPYGGSSRWRATRYLDAAHIKGKGDWKVCAQIFYDGWQTTTYSGTVTLSFIDATPKIDEEEKSPSDSSNGSGAAPSLIGLNNFALVATVFFLGLAAALAIALVIRKKIQLTDEQAAAEGSAPPSSTQKQQGAAEGTRSPLPPPDASSGDGNEGGSSFKKKKKVVGAGSRNQYEQV